MPIETTCRGCGKRFEPTSESIRRGDWQTCPACRQAQADRDAAVIARRVEVSREKSGLEAAS
jgi:hypothetical protein